MRVKWSLTLRKEYKLRVFENRVFRRIFEPKMVDLMGFWRKLDKLYSSPIYHCCCHCCYHHHLSTSCKDGITCYKHNILLTSQTLSLFTGPSYPSVTHGSHKSLSIVIRFLGSTCNMDFISLLLLADSHSGSLYLPL
jgi:hypothetical protein